MRTDTPVPVRRSDYAPPAWRIPRTRLHVSLAPGATRVTATLVLERAGDADAPLVLDGADFTLESVGVDGRELGSDEYVRDATRLTLHDLPERAELRLVTVLDPDANTALEGLYRSGGVYCTQCEAEGFRKITAFLDRPDVLSVFDVVVEGPRDACPVLLSNGNLVAERDLGNGRHEAHWHDPHPKPSYLFALVAGRLESIEDRFVTASGREVSLHVFTEAHNIARCDFAMASLKAAMRWDEDVYGFEYDLERFTIVAVDDFNMGAMENKGLNVFNTKYVLADAASATDADFLGIESVVAHEYFHNWTGNRITCRDWFQLSLKEGLTVFRDQCFSADRHSATVKRIEDVRLLRARQFPEDAGPMAHPIRPDSYVEINNFYTLTVYEKGAEVIRMLHTLLGEDGWRAGMARYVERHDGTAATCEDFVAAMEDASGVDLERFRRWYATAGTPVLDIDEHHDPDAARYTLTVRQSVPDTPGQSDEGPLHVPFRVALLDPDGQPVPVSIGRPDDTGGALLEVREREERFVFENVPRAPVASLLRGFSAPVRLVHDVDDATLAFLMARDTDPFNRWEAGQRLASRVVGRVEDGEAIDAAAGGLIDAIGACLDDEGLDPAFRAEVLSLPSFDTLAEERERIDVTALDGARHGVLVALATRWREPLEELVSRAPRAGDAGREPDGPGSGPDSGPDRQRRGDGRATSRERRARPPVHARRRRRRVARAASLRARDEHERRRRRAAGALPRIGGGADAGARRVPRALAGQPPRRRQVVRRAGHGAARGRRRGRAGTARAPRLLARQPQPRARAARELRVLQPRGLSFGERRGPRAARRSDPPARSHEPPDRRRAGRAARAMGALRRAVGLLDANRSRAHPGGRRVVAGRPRDRRSCARRGSFGLRRDFERGLKMQACRRRSIPVREGGAARRSRTVNKLFGG